MAETLGDLIVKLGSSYDGSGSDAAAAAMRSISEEAAKVSVSISEKFGKLGDNFKMVGEFMTNSITQPIKNMASSAFSSATDFETAFVGIRKTVDGEKADFDRLRASIMEMSSSTPFAASEIANVAAAAGQLGVGVADIEGFTKTMLMMGTATNLSAEEAATSLARFAAITGMPLSSVDKLGSSIVALGNNFATTESEIVNMGMRLAGAGSMVGMSEEQIMGLAAALSSVGIEAEAGGTAFSKVMLEINTKVASGSKDLKDFADIAGLSVNEFSTLWKKDAGAGLQAFINGLSSMKVSGVDLAAVLGDVGMEEIRVRDALMRSAGAAEMVGDAFKVAAGGFSEGQALLTEFGNANATTESKMAALKNTVQNVGINLVTGFLPQIASAADGIKNLAAGFMNLDDGAKNFILISAGVLAAIGPITTAIGALMKAISAMSAGSGLLAAFGPALPVILAVVAALGAAYGLYRLFTQGRRRMRALGQGLATTGT